MTENSQLYFGLRTGNPDTEAGFQSTLDYIRNAARSQHRKGELFERLMARYFAVDPLYKERFSDVWLWNQWAQLRSWNQNDFGIDLVARERNGGYCAIQCKCYAPKTRISKRDLDSFISESAREPYTARIVVDTGAEWGRNARSAIEGLNPACSVIRYHDLATRPIDWPDLVHTDPEQLNYKQQPFRLRPHQEQAFEDVITGFGNFDRGKLIMACGTGKTFTALKIAEEIAGINGRVLFLVPSIGLFTQTMREWAEQQSVPHHYIGICSDTRAGKAVEDASLVELEIPVTTNPQSIHQALLEHNGDAMTVVFCTYHSLPLVESAQDGGAPSFDIIICDEAHKTTGVDSPDQNTSPFVLVHDQSRIRANKRLYMTATSRLYTADAKAKAARHDKEVFSMDDPEVYGDEFHRLSFSKAVDRRILSDYKVVVLGMSEGATNVPLQGYVASGGSEVSISDATKIIGCWRALQNPERQSQEGATDAPIQPLRRAIAFTNTILASKRLNLHWNGIIQNAIQQMPEDNRPTDFACDTRHVDGTDNALDRKDRIEWLKFGSESECRILSNARCLTEGIDVPALDAVLIMSPRNSHIDIVQAVGRVMRQAEGKKYGYIILPIAIPTGLDPAIALNNNERFAAVWNVLRALRSHDDRFDAEINSIDLNTKRSERIIFSAPDENGGDEPTDLQMFMPLDIPADAIYAKIVEKCGDRRYWESWAKDIANIFLSVVDRVTHLLDNPKNEVLRKRFDDFHQDLKKSLNAFITRGNTIDMVAQHTLTHPVFEALFKDYDFASSNPVSLALDKLRQDLVEFGLDDETEKLNDFYESVRQRAQGIDNSAGRQSVLLDLYQTFFTTALKKDAERLGIVYTPTEVVDFILHSANAVLRQEFDRGLSDEGVHVLDPFVGTGVFLNRLLQSSLIDDSDVERKYREELHANEIVLLAYYIATVNIEEAYRGRRGEDKEYEPFNGIVLTDTFNLNKGGDPTLFPKDWLPDNNERAERQQKLPIQVIVGNPPWSAGQRRATDDNPNVVYPELRKRIKDTYVARSTSTNKVSLYDTYKMAIRWASDRIKGQGVIAFVTNGAWIDGNADSGVRACLAAEFSSIYVLNLRGNQRTQGERSKQEGGKIFGQGSRALVAITILVKNPDAEHEGCRIFYKDIGDYLKREAKLEILRDAESISGINDWKAITPNNRHDWINQRSEDFSGFFPIGSQASKRGLGDNTIFRYYSMGLYTGKDSYIYNFSREVCAGNAKCMVNTYSRALKELDDNCNLTIDEITHRYSENIRWDIGILNNLRRKKETSFSNRFIRKIAYRPFVALFGYTDNTFIKRKHLTDRIFPSSSGENLVICVAGIGSNNPFSVLLTDNIADAGFMEVEQCFPRYWYPKPDDKIDAQDLLPGIEGQPDRIDNISDKALCVFQEHYHDNTITKDQIFDYVYGFLHGTGYREEFASDLSKGLPRIPFATEFWGYVEAGKALARLHLDYESCPEYPLTVKSAHEGAPQPGHFRLTEKAMRFADAAKTTLIINEHIRLSGIPEEAHRYIVNGRTPLEWLIDRYKITRDVQSKIINDPNHWFDDPRDLIATVQRIVYTSVESARIIDGLPSFLPLAD